MAALTIKSLLRRISSQSVKLNPRLFARCPRQSSTAAFSRPDLDFDFLLDPQNTNAIKRNIEDRKQIGDIKLVLSLWTEIQRTLNKLPDGSECKSEREMKDLWEEFYRAALALPNSSHPSAPLGGEEDSRFIEQVTPSTSALLQPKTAEGIGGRYRSYRALTTSCGEKGYCLIGALARLQECLISYTRNKLKAVPEMQEISVPDIVNERDAIGCGMAADRDLMYLVADKESGDNTYSLSGTGEVGISRYISGKTFEVGELPLKLFTVSRCFRPEATSGGKVNSGLYRVHEFTKVEMYGVTENERGDESEEMLEQFVNFQKELCTDLGLGFKVMEMSRKELGASAYHKYDVEAWMPGRKMFGEVSSASNCTDFQSRRLGIKYLNKKGESKFSHTINATACASSRLMIALLESHQQEKLSLDLPEPLKPFLDREDSQIRVKTLDNNYRTDFNKVSAKISH